MNLKETKLFYSVGTHVAFDNWAVSNEKASYTEGVIMKFLFMAEAYNAAVKKGFIEGTEQELPKKEDLAMLPNSCFEEILAMVMECEKRDTKRKVEADTKKGKSTAK